MIETERLFDWTEIIRASGNSQRVEALSWLSFRVPGCLWAENRQG